MNKLLYDSDLVRIQLANCELPRSGPSTSYVYAETFIGLPLRGVFLIHSRRREQLLHPTVAALVPAESEYQMTHPTDGGDSDLLMQLRPDALEEAIVPERGRVQVTRRDLRMRLAAGMLIAAIERGEDDLVVHDLVFELLRRIASNLADGERSKYHGLARMKVERVRSLLAEHPEGRWTLQQLAELVGYSPFYLAHQFRAYTGTTVHQYLADLRAAAALSRIEAGDASLATIAADLGFAHHSHLTASLRRRLGMTPRMIRRSLRGIDETARLASS
jgi:AraC-like DNA-binding protein